jgi:hypothetical protein
MDLKLSTCRQKSAPTGSRGFCGKSNMNAIASKLAYTIIAIGYIGCCLSFAAAVLAFRYIGQYIYSHASSSRR